MSPDGFQWSKCPPRKNWFRVNHIAAKVLVTCACACGLPEIKDDQNKEGFVNFPEDSKFLTNALRPQCHFPGGYFLDLTSRPINI